MKDLFSSLKTRLLGGGGQQAFALQENKLYREEELLNNCNFDSLSKNDLQGGDLYLSTVTSAENHIGGGQLRSTKVNASSRSWNGGEGNYASLMSSGFADTETMLNPDHRVGGGEKQYSHLSKGGKPFNRLASYARNDFSFKKGGAGLTVCTPFYYEGGVCGSVSFWNADLKEVFC